MTVSRFMALIALSLAVGPAQSQSQQPCDPCMELAPRGALDHELTIGDLIVLQRFVVGLDTATVAETVRGDLAPASLDQVAAEAGQTPVPIWIEGDDQLSIGDVIVGLRILAGLETLERMPDPSVSFVTAPRACLGGWMTIWGRGLVIGDALPAVWIDGELAELSDVRQAGDSGAELDRITVREASGREPGLWTDGEVDVEVLTPRGSVSLGDAVELVSACETAPDITGLSEQGGSTAGALLVRGSGLSCLTALEHVSTVVPGLRVPAGVLAVHSDELLEVERFDPGTPNEDLFTVEASNGCGSARSPNPWRYPGRPRNPPDATWIVPPEGPADGGNSVQIGVEDGAPDLRDVDRIHVGPVVLDSDRFIILASGEILVPLWPPSPVGPHVTVPVDVIVEDDLEGPDETPLVYTYLGLPEPECGTIAPMTGPQEGGTAVIITAGLGSRLDWIDGVLFGGVPVERVLHPNSSQLAVESPAYPLALDVLVELQTDGVVVATCPLPFSYE